MGGIIFVLIKLIIINYFLTSTHLAQCFKFKALVFITNWDPPGLLNVPDPFIFKFGLPTVRSQYI